MYKRKAALPPDVRKGFAFPSRILKTTEAPPRSSFVRHSLIREIPLTRKGRAFPHIGRPSRNTRRTPDRLGPFVYLVNVASIGIH